jgi:superfamily II DNA or RNA helicase
MSVLSQSTPEIILAAQRAIPRVLSSLEASCRPETISRGHVVDEQGRVRLLELTEKRARAEVIGADEAPYETIIELDPELRSSCGCAAWGSWDDHCKHVVALALTLDRELRGEQSAWAPPPRAEQKPAEEPATSSSADHAEIREWLGMPAQPHSFSFELDLRPDLTVGVSRSDGKRTLGRSRWIQVSAYTGGRTLEPADRKVFTLLAGSMRDPEGWYHLSSTSAGTVLEALRNRPLSLASRQLSFSDLPSHLFGELGLEGPRRTITLRLRTGDGTLLALDSLRLLSEQPVFALHGNTLHRIETVASIEQLEHWQSHPTLVLARDSGGAFDFALEGLRRLGVILDATAEVAPPRPVFSLTLDGDAETARAMLAVRYGDVELPLGFAGAATHVTSDGRLLRRDVGEEAAAIDALLRSGLSRGSGGFVAHGDRAVEFWTRGVSTLPSDWQLYGPKPREVVRVRSLAPRVGLTQASTGWFTLEVAFAESDQSVDLERLRPLLASGRRYVKLADGSVGELPREIGEQIRKLLEESGAEPEGSKLELAPYEAGEVERLVDLVPDSQVAPETRRFLAALRDFHGIEEIELPAGLKADLRPYQKRGLDWLVFLHRAGMSGVLADDMGLGKTVQALALLLWAKKTEGRAPSLVVAPTSVIANWKREAERFAPNLKTILFEGPTRERQKGSFGSVDLVLTSYALLRRDFELLRKTKFRYVILDEAQHVKNPASLGARAACSLQADRRLALTGTPLENRLSDLWSLFHFLMPGFLGSETEFRSRYARPIEVDGNAGVRDRLKRRVHPFILRRLKDEVARDLPTRTDSVLPVELNPGQQALYREMLATAKNRVYSIIDAMGFKKAQISILAELLRLRQVCNDPRLLKLPPGTQLPPSAKLDAFAELVHDLIGEGHRALVFSQFTEMLGYLVDWAEEEGIRYEYLDGSTKDRQERVDRFNAKDGAPLFFISLKAGGTGLNLTGADYVIHYDPWWNPAVEQQAIDRVHRIGQTKPVFSYKLITQGTVEQKIVAMQARKKSLADNVLTTDDEIGKLLTEKDLEAIFAGV